MLSLVSFTNFFSIDRRQNEDEARHHLQETFGIMSEQRSARFRHFIAEFLNMNILKTQLIRTEDKANTKAVMEGGQQL